MFKDYILNNQIELTFLTKEKFTPYHLNDDLECFIRRKFDSNIRYILYTLDDIYKTFEINEYVLDKKLLDTLANNLKDFLNFFISMRYLSINIDIDFSNSIIFKNVFKERKTNIKNTLYDRFLEYKINSILYKIENKKFTLKDIL